MREQFFLLWMKKGLRLCTHEQIKHPLFEQICPELLMPRTHGENKSSLFAQFFHPYEVTLSEFAQINDGLFAHVY